MANALVVVKDTLSRQWPSTRSLPPVLAEPALRPMRTPEVYD